MPDFSRERLDEVEQQLHELQNSIEKLLDPALTWPQWVEQTGDLHLLPSLQFGLDTIVASRLAQSEDLPLYRWLFEQYHENPAVNITFSSDKTGTLIEKVDEACEDHWRTFKFKVGIDIDAEVELLKTIREQHPKINIRIDANQAWKVDEAIDALKRFAEIRPEYCEQPVHRDDMEGLKKVCNASPVPVAADEAITTPDRARLIIDQKSADVLILKPMLIGGLSDSLAIMKAAHKALVPVVITTLFDTAIGRLVTANLAAGATDPDRAHGLATGNVLADDWAADHTWMKHARFHLPQTAGLGLPIDTEDPFDHFGGSVEKII